MEMEYPQRGSAAPAQHAPGHERPTSADAGFDAFVAPYVQRLYRFLVLRLGDERDARDALQETLLAAWQGLPRLRERDRPWPWLVGIAAHKASDSARRRPRSLPLTNVTDVREHEVAPDVLAALERLPARGREVLLLRYLLRLSEAEVAAVLGVRQGTVKSRAARARAQLLEELG